MKEIFRFSVLLGYLFGTVNAACNTNILNTCKANLVAENFDTPLDQHLSTGQITIGCGYLESTDDCIETTSGCAHSDAEYKLYWAGQNDSLSFLCNERRSDFIGYQVCFDSSKFVKDINKCFGMNGPNEHANWHAWCNFYNRQLKCLNEVENNYACVPDDFLDIYYGKFIQPQMEVRALNCTLGATNASSCDVDTLNSCQDDLRAQHFDIPLNQQLSTEPTGPIATGCGLIDDTDACIETTSGCEHSDDEYKLYWAGQNDSLSFLCYERRSDFISYQACFDSTEFVKDINNCFKMNGPNENANWHAWCNFYNRQLKCLMDAEDKYICVPVDFLDVYYKKLIQPQTDVRSPDCVLDGSAASNIQTSIAALSAMLFLTYYFRHAQYDKE